MTPVDLLQSLKTELARITGLDTVLEPTVTDQSEVHLRVLLGAVDLGGEDEGMDGGRQVAFRFVVTLQAKGPGSTYWLNKVVSGCLKLATAVGAAGRKFIHLKKDAETVPAQLIKAERTSAADRQMFKNDQVGENPFEYYETWALTILVDEALLDL